MRVDLERLTMNTKSFKQRFQAGTGLIEVLVAILVLAVGMLGMSKLNALLIRDGGTANNRAIAVSLAQEKLDDLRGFKWLNAESSYLEMALDCGLGIFCFSEIATGVGGYEAPVSGTPRFPAGNVIVGNTTFNRTWTVVDTGTSPNVTSKLVTVTVTWTDQNGVASEVLTSAIWGDDAGVTAFGAAGPGIALSGPKVPYDAEADAVRIEIGSSAYKESSKPVPDVSQHGESTMVTFESTAYSDTDDTTISKEEFVTLSCVCEFEAANTRQGRTPTRMIWNNQTKELEPELGELVTKVTGRKPTSGNAANQPELCDSCCRDHHDVAGTTYPKYQPSRPSDDYSNGDHKHFWYNGGTLEVRSSGNYLEACRFQRVDGLFYAMQDWKMVDLVVMPKDNYLDNSTTMATYQTYLENMIANSVGGNAPNKTSLVDRNLLSLAQGQQAQLLARGLYIDPIYECRPGAVGVISGQVCASGDPAVVDGNYTSYVSALRVADTGGVGAWRKLVPFNEVNLTVLASWVSGDPSRVSVDNDFVQDIVNPDTGYYTTYYRGRVTGQGSAGSATITATARRGNTGVTSGVISSSGNSDGYGLSPTDDANLLSDSITVTRGADTTTFGISGNLQLTFGGVQANKPKQTTWGANASPNTNVTCTFTGNANNPGYSCTVPQGWTGTITPFASSSGGGGNDAAGTTYYFYLTSRPHTDVAAAATNQNFNLCKVQSYCLP